MKKQWFIILCLFFLGEVFGQVDISYDFDYSIGEPYEKFKNGIRHYFHKDGEILAIKVTRSEMLIQKFEAETLSLKYSKKYEDVKIRTVFEGGLEINGRYFAFFTTVKNKRSGLQFGYREIDFETGDFINPLQNLFTTSKVIDYQKNLDHEVNESMGRYHLFEIRQSFDKTKLMVSYKLKSTVKRHGIIGTHILDENLKTIWQKESVMPYLDKQMEVFDYAVDSDGSAYILATVIDDDSKNKKKTNDGKANYHLEILQLRPNSEDFNITKINIENRFTTKAWLSEYSDKMICVGYYDSGRFKLTPNWERKQFADGVFVIHLDKKTNIYEYKNHEIPLEILDNYEKRSERNKLSSKEESDKAELENLFLRDFFIDENGAITIIGEEYYQKNNRGNSDILTNHYYGNIFVTKLTADGEIQWMKKLPKRQQKVDVVEPFEKSLLSYKYLYNSNSNQHYFIYMDRFENLLLPINKRPKILTIEKEHGFLATYKIDDNSGKIKKSPIFKTKDAQGSRLTNFRETQIVQITSNEFIIEALKKRNSEILVKVSFGAN